MPSRRDHDVPAATISATIGVFLILVSLPFAVLAYQDLESNASEFLVSWSERNAVTDPTSPGQPAASVRIADGLPAVVRITSTACADSPGPGQNSAQLTVNLKRTVNGVTTDLGSKQYTCATASGDLVSNRTLAPDVGAITGQDIADAASNLADRVAAGLVTAEYTATVVATRSAAQVPGIPLPNLQSTLTATVQLSVTTWAPTLAEAAE
ncbi:MAG: hypothetical protein AABX89_02025 [Candidatus Thermoplasmatota archaeon]